MSLDSVLDHFGLDEIDYLKMDIEGAERDLLRAPGRWARSVRSMKVELHQPYTPDQAMSDLAALGFSPQPDSRHKSCVCGTRRPTQPNRRR